MPGNNVDKYKAFDCLSFHPCLFLSPNYQPFSSLESSWMSLQVQVELSSEKDTMKDQQELEDQKCSSSPVTITSDKDEGSQFPEGGTRGWATLIGA